MLMHNPIIQKKLIGIGLITFTLFVIVIILFTQEPISQDPVYHNFSDKQALANIPNLLNVICLLYTSDAADE